MRDGLRAEVERELLDPGLGEYFALSARRVAGIWKAFLAGETSWSRPWALFVIKNWVRRNFLGQS